jgi:hypothetical protein
VNSIWFHQRWSTTWEHVIDGIVYSLLVAAIFGALWPEP